LGLLPIAIAGPGATMILGRSTKYETAVFSTAGPLVNLGLAILAFPFLIYSSILSEFLFLFVVINAGLGVFNMLPFAILDGKKIFDYSRSIWLSITLSFNYHYCTSSINSWLIFV
jgi:Zn-dependent protease